MFILCAAAALLTQDIAAPERFAPARAAIEGMVTDRLAPAIAVAVLDGGTVVWAEGFGLADREQGRRATADSIFRLASISKPFTATALMRLVEQGELDLDASVNRYLEGNGVVAYRGDATQITLRRLANHTAGLPTHWSFYYAGSAPPPREVTIARYGFAAWTPGTRSNYSNLAFGVLDHVIARTSQRSFRAYLVAEVLDPLGMTHTDLGVRPGQEEHAAEGYVGGAAGRFTPVIDYGFDHDGASAVRSSARDLMRFAAMHLGDGEVDGVRLLRAETTRAMRVPSATPAGNSFGVAWSVGTARGTPAVRHTGGMPGVSTALELYPERHAAIAVLTNCSDRGATHRALAAIQDVLLGPAPTATPATPDAPARDAPAPDPAPVATAAGRYRGVALHHDGAIPIELAIDGDGDTHLRFGALDVRRFAQRNVRAERIVLRCTGALATTMGFTGTPTLDFELDRESDGGFAGVLSATGEATCRLPHWVQLAPVVAKPANTLRVLSVDLDGDPPPTAAHLAQAAAWLAARDADLVMLGNARVDAAGLRRLAAGWGHSHVAIVDATLALTSRTPFTGGDVEVETETAPWHRQTASIDLLVVPTASAALDDALTNYRALATDDRPTLVLGRFPPAATAALVAEGAVATGAIVALASPSLTARFRGLPEVGATRWTPWPVVTADFARLP